MNFSNYSLLLSKKKSIAVHIFHFGIKNVKKSKYFIYYGLNYVKMLLKDSDLIYEKN